MRITRIELIATTLILLLAASTATAGNMALAHNGSLFSLIEGDQELILRETALDGNVIEAVIPQTFDVLASSLQVGFDEATDTTVLVWQEDEGALARILIATYRQGTWFGPMVVAGDGSLSATHPALLVHRVNSQFEEEDQIFEHSSTFVHLVWWSGLELEDGGVAVYGAMIVNDDGTLDVEGFYPREVRDFIPYGINCNDINNPNDYAFPQLFVDPQSGDPHLVAVDVNSCLFQILQLGTELWEYWEGETKRRRHIIVFGTHHMIGINPDLPLHQKSRVAVGHNMAVVMYWDRDDSIAYAFLEESHWSDLKVLPLSAELDRESAVDLIRNLAR